jgi:small subunit ribosomal protein S12
MTINRLVRRQRERKHPIETSSPMFSGKCVKVYKTKPKKPNSAQRSVCKVRLRAGNEILAYIPGEKHNLQEHSSVLVRWGRTPDLPGFKYKVIRGKYDAKPVPNRKSSRSKYGASMPKQDEASQKKK